MGRLTFQNIPEEKSVDTINDDMIVIDIYDLWKKPTYNQIDGWLCVDLKDEYKEISNYIISTHLEKLGLTEYDFPDEKLNDKYSYQLGEMNEEIKTKLIKKIKKWILNYGMWRD